MRLSKEARIDLEVLLERCGIEGEVEEVYLYFDKGGSQQYEDAAAIVRLKNGQWWGAFRDEFGYCETCRWTDFSSFGPADSLEELCRMKMGDYSRQAFGVYVDGSKLQCAR